MLKNFKLILALAISLAGESLFNVAIIWQVLTQGGSAKTLGLFLCLITVISFLLQKAMTSFKNHFAKSSHQVFAVIRIFGAILSLLFIPLLAVKALWPLYVAGAFFTLLSFFSMITIEAIIGQEVLEQRLSSNKAARILQTAIQISAFLGAASTGFALSTGGMKMVLIANAACYCLGLFVFIFLKHPPSQKNNLETSVIQKSFSHTRLQFQPLLKSALGGLMLLTLQISAFNFLLPIMAQHEKNWSSIHFGIIDAMAGMGAFLCTFIPIENRKMLFLRQFSFIMIAMADILFHLFSNADYAAASAFFLGFFVNLLRIKQREIIYDYSTTPQQIMRWAALITVTTTFIKALSPLMFAFFCDRPSWCLLNIGIMVGLGLCITEIFTLIKTPILKETA